MNNENQFEYDKAFPSRFKTIILIFNLVLPFAIPIAAVWFLSTQDPVSKELVEAGRWATGVAVTSFLALTVAYGWLLSKASSTWPSGPKNPMSWTFYGSGTYLIFSIFILTLNPIMELGDYGESFDALGVVMPLGSVVFQFIGLLIIVQAWDAQRTMIQRRDVE